MKKMLIENFKPILVGIMGILVGIVALLGGSYTGGVITSVVNNDNVLGAIPGSSVSTQDFTVNGFEEHNFSSGLNKASSTICSFKTPNATTTLEFASVSVTTGTTTSLAYEIAKDTTFNASTTRLSYAGLSSGGTITLNAFVASTTGVFGALSQYNTADPYDMVFAPNTYLNVKIGGGGLGTDGVNTLVGSCKAKFFKN